jgi:hypothetical protein
MEPVEPSHKFLAIAVCYTIGQGYNYIQSRRQPRLRVGLIYPTATGSSVGPNILEALTRLIKEILYNNNNNYIYI